jgi:hypothetical protein
VQTYFEYFLTQADVVTHIGGVLGLDPALFKRGAVEENISEIKKTR